VDKKLSSAIPGELPTGGAGDCRRCERVMLAILDMRLELHELLWD